MNTPKPPLIRTMLAYADNIWNVFLTMSGHSAISISTDNCLHVWGLKTGKCLHILKGFFSAADEMTVTPDGQRSITAMGIQPRVWNLEKLECLCALKGHSDRINGVSTTPDGGLAISGSTD